MEIVKGRFLEGEKVTVKIEVIERVFYGMIKTE